MRFIQLVEDGTIKRQSALLIDSIDRFGRLPAPKQLALFTRVLESGVGLVFTGSMKSESSQTNFWKKSRNFSITSLGRLSAAIRNQPKSPARSNSHLQPKVSEFKRGKSYNIPHLFCILNKDKRKFEHNDKTKIVIELVKGCVGGKSLYEMAQDLNRRGVPTMKHAPNWSSNAVSRILRNPVIKGEYLGNPKYVPAFVDDATFNKVQSILSGNKYNGGQKGELVNMFRGVCFCADPNCGKAMQVIAADIIRGTARIG